MTSSLRTADKGDPRADMYPDVEYPSDGRPLTLTIRIDVKDNGDYPRPWEALAYETFEYTGAGSVTLKVGALVESLTAQALKDAHAKQGPAVYHERLRHAEQEAAENEKARKEQADQERNDAIKAGQLANE